MLPDLCKLGGLGRGQLADLPVLGLRWANPCTKRGRRVVPMSPDLRASPARYDAIRHKPGVGSPNDPLGALWSCYRHG